MADIMHKTSRLMAAVLLGCLLAGCGGQLLSHRKLCGRCFLPRRMPVTRSRF